MDKNDIIEMAQDAGARIESPIRWLMTQEELERFATLIAAAERDACAKVCENLPWISGHTLPSNVEMAAAIRARGN